MELEEREPARGTTSRRRFVQGAAAAGIGVWAAPMVVSSSSAFAQGSPAVACGTCQKDGVCAVQAFCGGGESCECFVRADGGGNCCVNLAESCNGSNSCAPDNSCPAGYVCLATCCGNICVAPCGSDLAPLGLAGNGPSTSA